MRKTKYHSDAKFEGNTSLVNTLPLRLIAISTFGMLALQCMYVCKRLNERGSDTKYAEHTACVGTKGDGCCDISSRMPAGNAGSSAEFDAQTCRQPGEAASIYSARVNADRRLRDNDIYAQDIIAGFIALRENEFMKYGLSEKERQIAAGVLNGESNESIAKRLFMSLSGVKYHVRGIYEKTGGRTREELCALIRDGMKSSRLRWRDRFEIYDEANMRMLGQ